MLYDGRRYTRNRHLGFRNAQEGDTYVDGGFTTYAGQDISTTHPTIFRIKDATQMERMGKTYYDPCSVTPDKCLPICAHTSSNVALGPPEHKTVGQFKTAHMNVGRRNGETLMHGQIYIEQAHYLVHDAIVYQWTSRRSVEQEDGI